MSTIDYNTKEAKDSLIGMIPKKINYGFLVD